MSYGSDSPGGSPDGIGGNESGIGGNESSGGSNGGYDGDLGSWGSTGAATDFGTWGSPYDNASFGDLSGPVGSWGDVSGSALSDAANGFDFGSYSNYSALGRSLGGRFGTLLGALTANPAIGMIANALGKLGGGFIGGQFVNAPETGYWSNYSPTSTASTNTNAFGSANSPSWGSRIAGGLFGAAGGLIGGNLAGNFGSSLGSMAGKYTGSQIGSGNWGSAVGSFGTANSNTGDKMVDGLDWGSLISNGIGLGASLYGQSQANKAASQAQQQYTNSALGMAAQENAWNRENAQWSMDQQERINKEQRQWELENNAAINQEGRQWNLDNNERLAQEYRDWNLNTNRDITDQNQQRQMDMLRQNRPNQQSDYGSVTWTTDANGNPVQTSSLAPELQGQLSALRGKTGEMIGNLDSGGFGVNNDVMGAIRGLQESGLSQTEQAQRARYAAMGIPLQSTAMDRGEQNLSRTRTDADLQAILAGNTAWQQGQSNIRENMQTLSGMEQNWNENLNNMPAFATGQAAQQGGLSYSAPTASSNFYTAGGTPANVPSYASSGLAGVAGNALNYGNTQSQAVGNSWGQIGTAIGGALGDIYNNW